MMMMMMIDSEPDTDIIYNVSNVIDIVCQIVGQLLIMESRDCIIAFHAQ